MLESWVKNVAVSSNLLTSDELYCCKTFYFHFSFISLVNLLSLLDSAKKTSQRCQSTDLTAEIVTCVLPESMSIKLSRGVTKALIEVNKSMSCQVIAKWLVLQSPLSTILIASFVLIFVLP